MVPFLHTGSNHLSVLVALSDILQCDKFLKIGQKFSRYALHSFCRAISSSIDSVFLAKLNQGLDVVAAGHVSTL